MAVDLNDMELYDEPISYDESINDNPEDVFLPKLPDDGKHIATVKLSQKGVTLTRTQKNAPMVTANLALEITEGGNRVATVFDSPNTGISTLYAVMALAGFPASNGISYAQLAEEAKAAFEAPFQVGIQTRWEASYKTADGKYVTFLSGQNNFPLRADGTPEATVVAPNGEEVRARASVKRYFAA